MLNIQCDYDLLADAAAFYANALGIAHYPADVSIYFLDNEDLDGYCGELDDDDYEIGVRIDGLNSLVTLAHEFVHLYQYLTGAMRALSEDKILYLDKVYTYRLNDPQISTYPFEIEAYDREQPLMIAFIKWYHAQGKI